MKLWVWSKSADFRIGFLLQGFCILYIILSEFLTKDVLECIVNPTYFIGCYDCNLFNLVFKAIVLILSTTHKTGCCKYWYCLGWYNLRRVEWGSLSIYFIEVHDRCYINRLIYLKRDAPTTTFVSLFILVLLILFLVLCLWYLHYVVLVFQ